MGLQEIQAEMGAVFTTVQGMAVPDHFGDFDAEYQAVQTQAGLVDLSARGKLRLTGKDRTRFLHGMVSNTVAGLAEGQGNHAALTTAQGQTLLDLWVYHLGDHLWLETDPGYASLLAEALDRYLIADDVEIANETASWVVLGVVGPKAEGVVAEVVDVMGLAERHAMAGQWHDCAVWVTQREFAHVPGYEVRVTKEYGGVLWQALVEAGATPAGWQVQETLRVEAGLPRAGAEITESVTPLEVGLDEAVDFNKGCYIGQEVIAKMHFRGKPRRYLVGLHLKDKVVSGQEIFVGEKAVGQVTSCVFSPELKQFIALAILRRGVHEPGQKVMVEGQAAAVVTLPFGAWFR